MAKKQSSISAANQFKSASPLPMSPMPGRLPSTAAVFELEAGPNLDIQCRRRAKLSINSGATLASHLARLAADDPGVSWRSVVHGRMNSALSIGLNNYAYLVFVLRNDPQAQARLSFSSRFSAFMAGSGEAAGRMFGPRCYVAGVLTEEFIPAPEDPLVTIALFAADMSRLGQRVIDFGFNINVDIVGRTGNGFAYRTPIIIDPDLRYPAEGTGIPTEP